MNGCKRIQALFTEYLDQRLSGREMQRIAAHLENCPACTAELRMLRQNQSALASLGQIAAPPELALRIRVALSQQSARRRQSSFAGFRLTWRNTLAPFLLHAAAGFASAVLLMGTVIVLVTMFTQPESARAIADEPLGTAAAPRFLYLASGAPSNELGAAATPVVVEAYVSPEGRVYDYRITSGPDDEITRTQVETLLLMSVFQPARRFGQPVAGLAVLSFSGVSVRG
jgi:predicted anti-sigma-YlaC factor YlaD